MKSSINDPYNVLEIENGAPLEDAKRSYRILVKAWHPDRFMDDPLMQKIAGDKLNKINQAYDQIKRERQISTLTTKSAPAAPKSDIRATTEGEGWNPSDLQTFCHYKRRAEEGDSFCQSELGEFYLIGKGVGRNATEAVKWFREAAIMQNTARERLGECYSKGEGVPINVVQAYMWFDTCSNARFKRETLAWGMTPEQIAEAQALSREWANKIQIGSIKSTSYRLLWCLLFYCLYTLMCVKGEPLLGRDALNTAAVWLGLLLLPTLGYIIHGTSEIINCRRKIAENNAPKESPLDSKAAKYGHRAVLEHSEAQYELGRYYDRGVSRDSSGAEFWYRKAAEQGHAEAQFALGMLYLWGDGVPLNYAEAARWFAKAAVKGHSPSQLRMGRYYKYGDGVPRNFVLSYMWFNLAAASGWGAAMTELEMIAHEMTPKQIAEAQKLSREWKEKNKPPPSSP